MSPLVERLRERARELESYRPHTAKLLKAASREIWRLQVMVDASSADPAAALTSAIQHLSMSRTCGHQSALVLRCPECLADDICKGFEEFYETRRKG